MGLDGGRRSCALQAETVDLIDAAAQDNRLLLAAISVWEVAMLEAKGRIRLDFPCGDG